MDRIANMALFAALMMTAALQARAAAAECTCTNRDGTRFNMGDVACIRVDGQAYMAECALNLNVTSWRKISDGCPVASSTEPPMSRRALPATL